MSGTDLLRFLQSQQSGSEQRQSASILVSLSFVANHCHCHCQPRQRELERLEEARRKNAQLLEQSRSDQQRAAADHGDDGSEGVPHYQRSKTPPQQQPSTEEEAATARQRQKQQQRSKALAAGARVVLRHTGTFVRACFFHFISFPFLLTRLVAHFCTGPRARRGRRRVVMLSSCRPRCSWLHRAHCRPHKAELLADLI